MFFPPRSRALGKLGAAKGGKARANTLTAEERKDIGQNAVRERWRRAGKLVEGPAPYQPIELVPAVQQDQIPFSMFPGKLKIASLELECHVLNDFRRVFTQREIVRVLSGGRDSGNLQQYLDRNPLFSKQFRAGASFPFKIAGQPTIASEKFRKVFKKATPQLTFSWYQ